MNAQPQAETPLTTTCPEEVFLDRMAQVLDAGAVSVMVSVGHKLRLFDTLAELPPSTSTQIAEAATLAERYVREWLAVMVVAKIIRYDPVAATYYLPTEHAACLTTGAAFGNLAVYAQFVGLAGSVQERILDCFATGDGLAYEHYPCFHHMMAEDSEQTVAANIIDLVAELTPGLTLQLEQGIDVLDAGCGAGRTLAALAEHFPNSRFSGYDLCADAIAMAKDTASRNGLKNINFRVVDLTNWAKTQEFDLITSFDAIHDTKEPQQLLAQIYAALRPNGIHLMQDIGGSAHLENNIDFPFAALLYTISTVHCMPVSLAQNGAGLGAMWGWETAKRMLQEVGFQQIERNVLPHDPMNVWFVSRKVQSHG